MLFQEIYNNAPLGALLRFVDTTSQPPERTHPSWGWHNGIGRLMQKVGSDSGPPVCIALSFDDSHGVMLSAREFTPDTSFRFEIIERPQPGMVLVCEKQEMSRRLVYIADDRASADLWLSLPEIKEQLGSRNIHLEDVN